MSSDTNTNIDLDELSDEKLDSVVERVIERKIEDGELSSDDLVSRLSRRDALKVGGASLLGGAVLGGASDKAAAEVQNDEDMAIGGTLSVDDSYKIAGSWYSGPASAQPASPDTNDQLYWDVVDASADTIRRERWDGSSWNTVGIDTDVTNSEQGNITKLSADHAAIEENASVIGNNQHNINKSAVDADGTHYGILHVGDAVGGDIIVYKADDSREGLESGWEEIKRWTSTGGPVPSLAITSNGTFLAGLDGNIYRATDPEESWTSVQSLTNTGTGLWNFSENGNGEIVAGEYQAGPAIWQSTDDGQTWTQIGDGNNLPFSDHSHQVKYHPADDSRIIATGGDSGTKQVAISNDNGSTWNAVDVQLQSVAVLGHPNDSSTFFLGTDDSNLEDGYYGIKKCTYTGGSSLDDEQGVLWTDLRNEGAIGDAAPGAFEIVAVTPDHGDAFYLTASYNTTPTNYLWASESLDGEHWRAVGRIQNPISSLQHNGANASVINTSLAEFAPARDRYLNLNNLAEFRSGLSDGVPVDARVARQIKIERTKGIKQYVGPDENGNTATMFRVDTPGGEPDLRIRYDRNSDQLYFADGADNQFVMDIGSGAFFQLGNGEHRIEDDYKTRKDGGGVIVTTPDGTDQYRIRVDNSGNVVSDGPL